MRTRGTKYWSWVDPQLHCRTHEEELSDGTTLDIQARLSRTGATQMFIGVYSPSGRPIKEEAYEKRLGETITRALAIGVERARVIASKQRKAA
ncbi:hypothetical protein K8374_13165 [Pseudomonas sp. p1(2021b)]|uniref:hypothetical protein n=1 Tax=Pseudomonas sp. p1(2021b) TaxID=2874628 RepID=UPI001CCB964F|nr:hypothetical protein [Pseudomonas sp. p1(2021b)]UBM23353.1 hypothetical protein K8374_13165 [Pseudomonas sp. p1(2021b)]